MNAPEAINRPWSPEAEQAVLGSLLNDPRALARLDGEQLSAHHFFDERNRTVFTAVVGIAAVRQPVDVVTVFESLCNAGNAESVGGLAYVNALALCVASASNVAHYARIVRDKATRRQIAEAADQALALVHEGESAEGALDRVQALFGAIQRTNANDAPTPLAEAFAARMQHWEALADGSVKPGISTGFQALDEALGGGLKPGKNLVFASRPGMGKSSLTQSIALHAAQQGAGVLILSQEMPLGDVVDRIAANLGRASLGAIVTRGVSDPEVCTRVVDASEVARRLTLWIDDRPALTLQDIRFKARQVHQRNGLALLVVDYLQLCAPMGKVDNRHQQVEQVSRGMKALAKELNITVLSLSQLNRQGDGVEPELAHLKESGAIEEDADAVILLHTVGQDPNGGVTVLAKIAKNRQGRIGRLALRFEPTTQRWEQSSADVTRGATNRAGVGARC
jgi:replicative DNA helicase